MIKGMSSWQSHDIEVQVDDTRIINLEAEIEVLKLKLHASVLRLSSICNSDSKIQFYTGFRNYSTLMALYKLLGPAVNCLNYWESEIKGDSKVFTDDIVLFYLPKSFLWF